MGYTPPQLYINTTTANLTKLYPPLSVANDDLAIYPNQTDTYPRMHLNGGASLYIYLPTGAGFNLYDATTNFLNFGLDIAGTQTKIAGKIDAYDLFLSTTGTGVIKFGTYTAGAATDSTGYITIKDAAGTTRKLMVQA